MSETEYITQYHFIPWVRRGLAGNKLILDEKSPRARIDASLKVRVIKKDSMEEIQPIPQIPQSIYLYGPGDILGFDPRIVVRTEPQPDVSNFEYNYFPAIEFADPDFPWRFTPDNPEIETGKLQPWITLVVLVAESSGGDVVKEFEEGIPNSPNLPGCICVDPGVLPDLQCAWRWAHVQVTTGNVLSGVEVKRDEQPDQLEDLLKEMIANTPERAISRLLCARRLRPNVRYAAFVMPTFRSGLRAALGLDLDSNAGALDPAWSAQMLPTTGEACTSGKLKLPYYYRWEFRTGELADFEYLVRLLEPRKLSGIGIRNIDCSKPGFGTHGVNRDGENGFLGMEGALMAEDTEPTPWGMDNQQSEELRGDIADLINGRLGTGTVLVSDVTIKAVPGSSSVELSWNSSSETTARIDYGLLPSYCFSERLRVSQKSHKIALKGLLPGRLYYFRITTQTADGAFVELPGSFTIPILPCVTPAIYGRWHRAVDRVDPVAKSWIHELNLDPRHRAAAGLGAEVIRLRDESLMAAAWDQLGPIQTVNDGLRLAQFGREVSKPLYRRIKALPIDRAIQFMVPAMRRIIVQDPDTQNAFTATHCLHTQSLISSALVDPSFRRLMNPFGPVLSRQRLFQKQPESSLDQSLLSRAAMGDPSLETASPTPVGTMRPFHIAGIVKNALPPAPKMDIEFVTPSLDYVPRSMNTRLSIHIRNSGKVPLTVKEIVLVESFNNEISLEMPDTPFTIPIGHSAKLKLILSPSAGQQIIKEKVKLIIETDDPDDPLQEISVAGIGGVRDSVRWVVKKSSLQPAQDPALKFADGRITSQDIEGALADNPFAGMSGIPDPQTMADSVASTLDWLNSSPSGEARPSERSATFLPSVKDQVVTALNPETTLVERSRKRLHLNSELAQRFDHEASGDRLDPIMWAPEFSSAMYEPLKGLSHDSLLPGVEKISQNTIGILYVNRRFIESYLCGLNHEFASELLWRGFPTDQRGSYFRQFWDVSKYIPNPAQLSEVLQRWLEKPDSQLSVAYGSKELSCLLEGWLESNNHKSINELSPDEKNQIINRHRDEVHDVSNFTDEQRTTLVEFLVQCECLDEMLKDISPLTQWQNNNLGENRSGIAAAHGSDEPNLVLVIRGELLRRYPDASIYAIDSDKLGDAQHGDMHSAIRPVFEATLPPDLTFCGFPFTKSEAIGNGTTSQKYFVIEEHLSHTHFGLDESLDETGGGLSWADFGLDGSFGSYLDSAIDSAIVSKDENPVDSSTSSAGIALNTLQIPVRVFIPASRMIKN